LLGANSPMPAEDHSRVLLSLTFNRYSDFVFSDFNLGNQKSRMIFRCTLLDSLKDCEPVSLRSSGSLGGITAEWLLSASLLKRIKRESTSIKVEIMVLPDGNMDRIARLGFVVVDLRSCWTKLTHGTDEAVHRETFTIKNLSYRMEGRKKPSIVCSVGMQTLPAVASPAAFTTEEKLSSETVPSRWNTSRVCQYKLSFSVTSVDFSVPMEGLGCVTYEFLGQEVSSDRFNLETAASSFRTIHTSFHLESSFAELVNFLLDDGQIELKVVGAEEGAKVLCKGSVDLSAAFALTQADSLQLRIGRTAASSVITLDGIASGLAHIRVRLEQVTADVQQQSELINHNTRTLQLWIESVAMAVKSDEPVIVRCTAPSSVMLSTRPVTLEPLGAGHYSVDVQESFSFVLQTPDDISPQFLTNCTFGLLTHKLSGTWIGTGVFSAQQVLQRSSGDLSCALHNSKGEKIGVVMVRGKWSDSTQPAGPTSGADFSFEQSSPASFSQLLSEKAQRELEFQTSVAVEASSVSLETDQMTGHTRQMQRSETSGASSAVVADVSSSAVSEPSSPKPKGITPIQQTVQAVAVAPPAGPLSWSKSVAEGLRLFRMGVDVRSVRDLKATHNIYVQYSLGEWTGKKRARTSPPLYTPAGAEVTFANSFSGVEIQRDRTQAEKELSNQTVMLHVFACEEHAQDVLLGACEVAWKDILPVAPQKLPQSTVWVVDKWHSLLSSGHAVGLLRVTLSVEDLGVGTWAASPMEIRTGSGTVQESDEKKRQQYSNASAAVGETNSRIQDEPLSTTHDDALTLPEPQPALTPPRHHPRPQNSSQSTSALSRSWNGMQDGEQPEASDSRRGSVGGGSATPIVPLHSQGGSVTASVQSLRSEVSRSGAEYQIMMELEAWKIAEQQRFVAQMEEWYRTERQRTSAALRAEEESRLNDLEGLWKKKVSEREQHAQQRLQHLDRLEEKLRLQLLDVEAQNKKIMTEKSNLDDYRLRLQREAESRIHVAEESAKLAKEAAAHHVTLEKANVAALQGEVGRWKERAHEAEGRADMALQELQKIRGRLTETAEFRLQAQLNKVVAEKTEMSEAMSKAVGDKERLLVQLDAAQAEIRKWHDAYQQEKAAHRELQQRNAARKRVEDLTNESMKTLDNDRSLLQGLRSDISQLARGKTKESTAGRGISRKIDEKEEAEEEEEEGSENVGLARPSAERQRLEIERSTLLRTGVYTEKDRVIMALDKRIAALPTA
jgi:hypothetical protein